MEQSLNKVRDLHDNLYQVIKDMRRLRMEMTREIQNLVGARIQYLAQDGSLEYGDIVRADSERVYVTHPTAEYEMIPVWIGDIIKVV